MPDALERRLERLEEWNLRLTQRLGAAERAQRRARHAGGLAAAAVAVCLLAGARSAQVSKVVEAETFVLRDASGKTRGSIGFSGNGRAQVVLKDGEGRTRLDLGLSREGHASLSLTDDRGKGRLVVASNDEGPHVILADKNEVTRFQASLFKDEPQVFLVGADGKQRLWMRTAPNDGPGIVFLDPKGHARAALGLRGDGSPGLQMTDGQERLRALMSVDKHGTPEFTLQDEGAKGGLRLSQSEDSTELKMYDGEGRTRSGLGLYQGNPHLDMNGPDEELRLTMCLTKESYPLLGFRHGDAPRMVMLLKPDGSPLLRLNGEDARPLFEAPIQPPSDPDARRPKLTGLSPRASGGGRSSATRVDPTAGDEPRGRHP